MRQPEPLKPCLLRLLKIALVLGLLGGLGLLVAFAVFIAVLQVSRQRPLSLPAPTGEYAVGRSELEWTEPGGDDPLADAPGAPRALAVWIWYPAQVDAGAQPAPYLPPAWANPRAADQGAGILLESEPSKIVTHSYAGAPLAAGPAAFPLLIMQPGMGPSIPDYTVLAEELASHGYVVAGLNTSDTSNLVVFPDGRLVTRSQNGAIPDRASRAEADQLGDRIMAVWKQDVVFALDQLQSLDADPASPFYRRLDLQRVGVFGHSFGGATALSVCQQDPRCKAGADLDGTPFPAEARLPMPHPFLFLTEDYSTGCDRYCAAIRRMIGQPPPAQVYNLMVKGARHFNFSDLPLRQVPAVRPLFRLAGFTGSIDPQRGEQIAAATLLAFFDQALKGQPATLLQGPSPEYPEVLFEK